MEMLTRQEKSLLDKPMRQGSKYRKRFFFTWFCVACNSVTYWKPNRCEICLGEVIEQKNDTAYNINKIKIVDNRGDE